MKNFLYLVICLFCFSCSLFKAVDVPENRDDNKKDLVSVELGLNVITNDLGTLTTAIEKGQDPVAKKKLAQLTYSQRTIIQNYVRTKEDMESSRFKDRERIGANDPDFAAAEKEQKDFQNRFTLLDNQLKNYRAERNALKDYLESKGIYRVDGRALNRDFIQALNDTKKIQREIKNELMSYSVRLNNSTDPEEKKKKHKATIQELVKIVEQMENTTFRLQRVHVATMAEVGSGVKYVTPGMRAHNYPLKIKSLTDMIQAEESKFRQLAKSLELP
jgi:hypothetical protein